MNRASDQPAGVGGADHMEAVDLTVDREGSRSADNTTHRDTRQFSTVIRSEQCTARAKATGQRCRRLVKAGGVCVKHGGAAGQVRRAREARIAVAEARQLYADDFAQRSPSEVLLGAVGDADALVQRLKQRIELSGELMPSDIDALGQWLDRASRMSRAAIDAGVQERLAKLEEDRAALIFDLIRNVLGDLDRVLRAGELRSLSMSDPTVQRVLSARLEPLRELT